MFFKKKLFFNTLLIVTPLIAEIPLGECNPDSPFEQIGLPCVADFDCNGGTCSISGGGNDSNNLPTATNVTITGTLTEGETISVSYNFSDPDPLDTELGTTFKWFRANANDCSNSELITTEPYGTTTPDYTLQASDVGKYMQVWVYPNDGKGAGSGVESNCAGPILADAVPDVDSDSDGITDINDNCPYNANPDQLNNDGDKEGDACDNDDDNDKVIDETDNCPLVANVDQVDTDLDGLGNACDIDDDDDEIKDTLDNCQLVINPDQDNNDGDVQGDACDDDDDNDGILDATDNCPYNPNPDQKDTDQDNIGDVCDETPNEVDSDSDGVADTTDNCPYNPNPDQRDTDSNGVGDVCDEGNQILWIRQFTGDSDWHDDSVESVVIDEEGFIYITGNSGFTQNNPMVHAPNYDAIIAKYTSGGEQVWFKELNTTGMDYGLSIASDHEGKIYVTGHSVEVGMFMVGLIYGSQAFYTKYDSNGTHEWTKPIYTNLHANLDTNLSNILRYRTTPREVAIDTNDNIYIVGDVYKLDPNAFYGGFIVKYDSDGNKIGEADLNLTNAHVFVTSVAIDSNDNIYLMGHTNGSFGGVESISSENYNVFIAKYNSNLERIWIKQQGSIKSAISTGISTDAKGNVYATGYIEENDSNKQADIFLVKYDSDGNIIWYKIYSSPQRDVSKDVTTDNDGNVYVTGHTNGSLGGQNYGEYDAFVLKFLDSNGTLTGSMNLGTHKTDAGEGIAIDADGYVYVGGRTNGEMEDGIHNYGNNDAILSKLLVVKIDEKSEGKEGGGALGYFLPLLALMALYLRRKQYAQKA